MKRKFTPPVHHSTFFVFILLIAAAACLSACAREGADSVSVADFAPSGVTQRYTNISVEFSKAIVDRDSVGVLLDSAPVEFTPVINGRFKWIDTHTLRFLPTEPLKPSTDYSARLRPQITGSSGLILKGPREFRFNTPYLKVTHLSHVIERLADDPTRARFLYTIEFNAPVEPGALAENLQILLVATDGRMQVPFSVVTTAVAQQFEIESGHVPIGEEGGEIWLSVDPGLEAVGGSVPLLEKYIRESSFGATQELKVNSIRPRQSGSVYAVVIRFSSAVDADLAERFISIEPEGEFRISEYGTGLRLTGNLVPGSTITVQIDRGLMARDGARLNRDFRQPVLLGDLRPSLNFPSPGQYLSREGLKNVGIELINVEGLHLEVEKIYRNNLVHFQQGGSYYYMANSMGRLIYEEDVPLSMSRNEVQTATVNFEGFLKEHPAGLFRLRIRAEGRYWRTVTKTVLLTDIGLLGKRSEDELYIWALSTSSLEPLSGVDITLYSTNNQVLGTAVTDAAGAAVIRNLTHYLDEFKPYLVAADRGAEFSFLQFDECEVATADFDVDGRPALVTGYEAFIYGGRGVYRPGETVNLAGVIRSPATAVPPSFPIRLKVTRPDGRILLEKQARTLESGMVEFDAAIPTYAPTGRYQAELFGPEEDPIGTLFFGVEEFIPDRIKVEVETEKETYGAGEVIRANVIGTMLFGPPAAGRDMDAVLLLEAVPFAPAGYTEFQFGNSEKEFTQQTIRGEGGKLDTAGVRSVDFEIPATLKPPAALAGIVQATVHEDGGRAVSGYTTFPVHVYPFYTGLRREQEGYAEVGRPQTFHFINLDPDGEQVAADSLQVAFSRIRWRTVLTRDSRGRYRYVSERSEEPLETLGISAARGEGSFSLTPPDRGQFRVTLTDPGSGGSTSITFYASGWGYSPWSMEKPGQIELELDRANYSAGEEARVLVKAPFGGKLLLTVERERILSTRMIDMEENTADIPIRVRSDFLPNVYVTATIVRSHDSAEPQTPMRAYGTVPLMVDTGEKRLDLQIETPSETLPRRSIDVEIRLDRAGRNAVQAMREKAFVTIAAVDEGILQLTEFATPDPVDFFYGKKRLDVATYDLFALLLPELEQSELFSAPSGDRLARRRAEHLSPVTARRVKPVAFWSGILQVSPGGVASTSFELPEFNGTLRVMAVAAAGDMFGSAAKDVRVRDPIVMTPTFPRFFSMGDLIHIPVNVFNGTGRDGSFQVTLHAEGPAGIIGPDSRSLDVGDEEEVPTGFIVKAGQAAGVVTFTLNVEGNGVDSSVEVEVPLRPSAPYMSRTGMGSVGSGDEASFRFPSEWITGTESFTLTVSPFPAVEFSGGLQDLLRYPYGCIEQTTSQAFPLLYFKDLARQVEPALFDTNAPEYFVEEAIRKLAGMQLSDGGFTFWPNSSGVSEWGSIYALHFLVEAGRAGYTVPDNMLRRGARYLRTVLFTSEQTSSSRLGAVQRSTPAYQRSVVQRLRLQTYSAYVLSLMNRPERGAMTFLLESMESEMTLESRFLLAGAFALVGDRGTALRLLPTSLRPQDSERETGGTFSSSVRNNAIVLVVLADIAPEHPGVPLLVEYLGSKATTGRWGSTQENAWAFLALGKIMRRETGGTYRGTLSVDGEKRADLESETYTLDGDDLGGKEIGISISGDGRAYYFWEARGIPVGQTFEETDQGISVSRRYLDIEGRIVQPDSIAHGSMLVVEIAMVAHNQNISNIVIDDMLPAGLEIENPRLESRAALGWLPQNTISPDYIDIRDDRLLLFLDLNQSSTARKFYYAVRAVTEGEFVLPPVSAECMYDSSLRSIASSGRVKVRKP